jgi:hypothetical protein
MSLIKCLNFNNVVGTGMATLDLSNALGQSIDRIVMKLGGTFTKAMISGIRIKAAGKLIYEDTGPRIDARMKYRGIEANDAFLTVDFTETTARTIEGQMLGAIDTTLGPLKSISMEVDIAGATSPTLEAWAMLSESQANQRNRSLIGKVLTFNHYFGASGKFPLAIPYGQQGGALIRRLHLFGATVTGAEVKKNGGLVFEATDAVNEFIQGEFTRAPQANVFTLDFVVDGNMSNVLNAANARTMEYYATVSGAGNVAVVAELLDPLANN